MMIELQVPSVPLDFPHAVHIACRVVAILACAAMIQACVPPDPADPPECVEADVSCPACADCTQLEADCAEQPLDVTHDEAVELDVVVCEGSADCSNQGVCEGVDLARCVDGAWVCDYGAVPGFQFGGESQCDGLDNDCDGLTDESLDPHWSGCLTEGVCAAARAVCLGETGWLCGYEDRVDYQSGAETTCDGIDNNCDGTVDEDLCLTCPGMGLRECDGPSARVCAPDGNAWIHEDCPAGQVCMGLGVCTRDGTFRVNAPGALLPTRPALIRSDGKLVVAWSQMGLDANGRAIVARTADLAGVFGSAESVVNVFETGDQSNPALAPLPDGGWLAVWESDGQDGSGKGLYGRPFAADGTGGMETRLTVSTTGNQEMPFLLTGQDGETLMFWSERTGSEARILGGTLTADGWAQPFEWLISGLAGFRDELPAATWLPDGKAVVVWGRRTGPAAKVVTQLLDVSEMPWVGGSQIDTQAQPGDIAVTPVVMALGSGFFLGWLEQYSARICLSLFTSTLVPQWVSPTCVDLDEAEVAAFKLVPIGESRAGLIYQEGTVLAGTLRFRVLDGSGTWVGDPVTIAEGRFPERGRTLDALNPGDGRILVVYEMVESGSSPEIFARFVSID